MIAPFATGRVSAQLDRAAALRFLGYAGQSVQPELTERFEALAARCDEANEGGYVWLADKVDGSRTVWEGDGAGVALEGCGLRLPGISIARHLQGVAGAGPAQVVLVACTLGSACDQELRQLKALNTLDFLMYDACASALAEAVVGAVHDQIAQEAKVAGLFAHARFSPGYGDLPLDVQPDFLRVLGAPERLGLHTNQDNFLVPTKSVTAIIGLFEDEQAPGGASPCGICAAFDYCNFRERGLTCHGK